NSLLYAQPEQRYQRYLHGSQEHRTCWFSRVRCCPSSVKFAGSSQRSNSARRVGHSESIIENQAVSRFTPLMIMCCRKMPSKVNPSRSAAAREGSLCELHFH